MIESIYEVKRVIESIYEVKRVIESIYEVKHVIESIYEVKRVIETPEFALTKRIGYLFLYVLNLCRAAHGQTKG